MVVACISITCLLIVACAIFFVKKRRFSNYKLDTLHIPLEGSPTVNATNIDATDTDMLKDNPAYITTTTTTTLQENPSYITSTVSTTLQDNPAYASTNYNDADGTVYMYASTNNFNKAKVNRTYEALLM